MVRTGGNPVLEDFMDTRGSGVYKNNTRIVGHYATHNRTYGSPVTQQPTSHMRPSGGPIPIRNSAHVVEHVHGSGSRGPKREVSSQRVRNPSEYDLLERRERHHDNEASASSHGGHAVPEAHYEDYVTRHNETFKATLDGPNTKGLLARWETGEPLKPQSKRILSHHPAATPQYMQNDYLKPQNINTGGPDGEPNYAPTSNIRQTRFHRGFQRRHQTDIQQDSGRLARELKMENQRDERDAAVIQQYGDYRDEYTFNVLTGEGAGRDGEFRQLGKRILNPTGNMPAVFGEHETEARNRLKNSSLRFGEYPPPMPSNMRAAQLVSDGISVKESMIIGYGNGPPRQKMASQGTSDNFDHLANSKPPVWEAAPDKNKSQIVFG